MTLLEECENFLADKATHTLLSHRIVFLVAKDLQSRGGMSWDEIDDETQEEILRDLVEIVDKELAGYWSSQYVPQPKAARTFIVPSGPDTPPQYGPNLGVDTMDEPKGEVTLVWDV